MGTNRPPDRYGSIRLALDVLRYCRQPRTLEAIAEHIDTSQRTARRIVEALEAAGVTVTREPDRANPRALAIRLRI